MSTEEFRSEIERWQHQREEAKRHALFRERSNRLPCVEWPEPYLASEEPGNYGTDSRDTAKILCNKRCPVRDLCLEEALREEVGLRPTERFGVVGGMDASERFQESRRRGCPICGASLPSGGRSVYCEDHARKGARDRALERRTAVGLA